VLIVGHNPGLQDLLARLTGQTKQMSTASLACLEFAVDKWQDIENNSAKLVYLLAPRQ
jgi:phosphohistidine phosphatase